MMLIRLGVTGFTGLYVHLHCLGMYRKPGVHSSKHTATQLDLLHGPMEWMVEEERIEWESA